MQIFVEMNEYLMIWKTLTIMSEMSEGKEITSHSWEKTYPLDEQPIR